MVTKTKKVAPKKVATKKTTHKKSATKAKVIETAPVKVEKHSAGTSSSELQTVKKAQMKLRALNHPLRQKMLKQIGGGGISVTELYKKLGIEQSVASQHLKFLRDASVVNTKREGKKIFYSVNQNEIQRTINLCDTLVSSPKEN